MAREYNPLDYENLTRNCVQELMRRGPYSLELQAPFEGAGVYALFYRGPSPLYGSVRSPDAEWPIYVGKAVPKGARKGAKSAGPSRALYSRLRKHRESISFGNGLSVEDFQCRYLVVTPLWITMAERFLIEHYQPVWNVCLEGFGIHDPGRGRYQGECSSWDTLHPGRPWAARLVPRKEDREQVESRVKDFLTTRRPGVRMPALKQDAGLFADVDDPDET